MYTVDKPYIMKLCRSEIGLYYMFYKTGLECSGYKNDAAVRILERQADLKLAAICNSVNPYTEQFLETLLVHSATNILLSESTYYVRLS